MGSKKPFKLIIAGSREFDDYETLELGTDWFLYEMVGQGWAPDDIEIVSGTALGADRLGERYAIDNGFSIKRFPANWTMHGKSAGFKRNRQMAVYADALIAFPLGKSSGTRDMIKQARGLGLTVRYGARCANDCISYADEVSTQNEGCERSDAEAFAEALVARFTADNEYRQSIEDDNEFMLEEMDRECERTTREVYAEAMYQQNRYGLVKESAS